MDDIQLREEINYKLKEAIQFGKTPALSYDRVSTEEQATTGTSLEDQNSRAKEYADQKNLHLVYQFTATESAFKEGRATFNKMIDVALQNGIQHLIFKNTDRLARNDSDWMRCKTLVRQGSLVIHLYELGSVFTSHSTAEELMFLDNTSVMARYWSNKISQGVKGAYRRRVKQGRPLGSAPIGYIFDKEKKTLVFDNNTRNMMCLIFDTFDDSKISVYRLVELLNERGYKTKTGRNWLPQNLHAILKNPVYAGFYYHNEIEYQANFESYYSRERYEKRLKRLSQKFHGNKKCDFEFVLKNLVYTEDDRMLTGEMKKGKYVYYTHRRPYASYSEDFIFNEIDREIEAIQYSADFAQTIKQAFKNGILTKTKDHSSQMAFISKQISDLEVRQQKILKAFEDDEIDHEALKTRLNDIRNQIKNLQEQRNTLMIDSNQIILDISIVIDYLRKLPEIYRTADRKQKALILNEIAHRINVNQDNVEIVWNDQYQLLLNKDILQFADTPAAVRKYPLMLPR